MTETQKRRIMKSYLENVFQNITVIGAQLSSQNQSKTTKKIAEDKWSPNEILGHLVDSAINNHRRFVLMQIQHNLVFDGYDQDAWVKKQNYQFRDWNILLNLWLVLNKNIIVVLKNVNPDLWNKRFKRHNLHQIAWMTVPKANPISIEYFVKDYFGHLTHHINQIYAQLNLDFDLNF